MESLVSVAQFAVAHYAEIASAIVAILSGSIVIAMLIPGEQPEKTLQKIVDVLAKFSKK